MAEEAVVTLRQADGLNAQEGDQGKRLKEVETENACLWRAVSDLALDKMMLSEVARTFSPLAAELVGSRYRGTWCVRTMGMHCSWSASLHTA